jgi:hypothetical protein
MKIYKNKITIHEHQTLNTNISLSTLFCDAICEVDYD